MKRWLRDLYAEWRARRAGRRHLDNDLGRLARDVTGPTGWAFSNAWDSVNTETSDLYRKSFDKGRPPPSTYISARDAVRVNNAMPIAERCIEDFNKSETAPTRDWSTAELDETP